MRQQDSTPEVDPLERKPNAEDLPEDDPDDEFEFVGEEDPAPGGLITLDFAVSVILERNKRLDCSKVRADLDSAIQTRAMCVYQGHELRIRWREFVNWANSQRYFMPDKWLRKLSPEVPDWLYWGEHKALTLEQAACLACGFEPRCWEQHKDNAQFRASNIYAYIERVKMLAESAVAAKELTSLEGKYVRVHDFAEWCGINSVGLPKPFHSIIEEQAELDRQRENAKQDMEIADLKRRAAAMRQPGHTGKKRGRPNVSDEQRQIDGQIYAAHQKGDDIVGLAEHYNVSEYSISLSIDRHRKFLKREEKKRRECKNN